MTEGRKIAKIMKSCEGVASVAEAAWQVNILAHWVWLALINETHVWRLLCMGVVLLVRRGVPGIIFLSEKNGTKESIKRRMKLWE